MINSPAALLALLTAIVWGVTTLSGKKFSAKFFKYLPAPLWCYFIPTLLSTFGIIPSISPLYVWMSRIVLPACLILLLVGTDLPAILSLSPRAIAAMAAGSAGIFLGGILTFTIYQKQIPELWRGWACLSASWTGGSANMLSVREILQTPATLFSSLVIVDTAIAYSWMAFLVYLSRYEKSIDAHFGAVPLFAKEAEIVINEAHTDESGSSVIFKAALLLMASLSIAAIFWKTSGILPQKGDVLNRFTWLILLSTAFPLILSLTPASKVEAWGATKTGNFLLYVLLTSIGAKADLHTLKDAPMLIALGYLWAAVHGLTLYAYGKITRTPMAILAAASQANIGGTVSTPLVASVYDARLAPMGLILAVLGNIYGTYFALAFSEVCRRW